MKPLYKLDQQRLDRLLVRDLSHAHSSNPYEGIIQLHFLLVHQIFLLALRATNTRIHLFTSILFYIQIVLGDRPGYSFVNGHLVYVLICFFVTF